MQIRTDLGTQQGSPDAKGIAFQPVAPLTATNIEDAINQVQANAASAGSSPPTIAAKTVNFAASPYQVLATDYILEVDTSGGSVVITPLAVGTASKPLEIKDVTGNAGANNIQINAAIEGQNPYLIDSNYGNLTIRPNAGRTAYEVVTW